MSDWTNTLKIATDDLLIIETDIDEAQDNGDEKRVAFLEQQYALKCRDIFWLKKLIDEQEKIDSFRSKMYEMLMKL